MLADLEAKRKETKEAIEARREAFKQEVEERREVAKTDIAEKRKQLKERLQTIKDARKRSLIEKLDTQLDDINARYVDRYSDQLAKSEEVLQKIISRTDKAEAAGSVVSDVRSAISAAEAAIASARAQVATQTGKTYVINVTTETELRVAVEAARGALRTDLKVVADLVRAAQAAVRKAATALLAIPGVGTKGTTTPVTTN
jgi:DNA repair exonuclease SbcCD ATPase subunit